MTTKKIAFLTAHEGVEQVANDARYLQRRVGVHLAGAVRAGGQPRAAVDPRAPRDATRSPRYVLPPMSPFDTALAATVQRYLAEVATPRRV